MASVDALELVVHPRTALELRLTRIWEEVLDRRPIGIDEDFFAMGGDSISAMTLLARVARETDYTLPAGGILQAPTVEKLAVFLQSQKGTEGWDPLVPLQTRGQHTPFFCVHPGGGNVLCYLQLSQILGPDQPFYGLQAPGVDGVREPLSSVEEMAREYVAAIRRVQPHGPYLIGGWSVGGVVAFEVASQLVESGEDVATVVILDSGVLYSHALLTSLFVDGGFGAITVLQMPFAQQVEEFRRRSAAAGLVPSAADDQMAANIYRVFAANMRALLHYRPRWYEGRVDLLQARETMVPERFAPHREWKRNCPGVRLHTVPGNHLTMIQAPHVDVTADVIAACLTRAEADYEGRRNARPR